LHLLPLESFAIVPLCMPRSIHVKSSCTISDICSWHTLTLDDFIAFKDRKDDNRASIESVYLVIKKQSGRVTTRHIEREAGLDIGIVRHAIKHLTREGKIQRVRGLGINKIEFYYKICMTGGASASGVVENSPGKPKL
jgi:hypothetical protein